MYSRLFPCCFLLGLFLPVACTRVVDLVPEGTAQVVVNCVLSEDSIQTLSLGYTDIVTEADKALLETAGILLTDETAGVEAGRFVKKGETWYLPYSAVPEHKYRITIQIPGRDVISAVTSMPAPCGIERFHIPTPGVEHNADDYDDVEWGMRYNTMSLPTGPVWVMGMNYDSATGKHIPADFIASSLISGEDPFNATDSFFFSKDFFRERFLLEVYGIRFYRHVDGHPFHPKLLRIRPANEGGGRAGADPHGFFSVAGTFEGDYFFLDTPSETQGYVLFVAASEELDRFLKEALMEQIQQEQSVDYSFLFSRNNLYTNIENGVGVFGAKTEQKLPWIKHADETRQCL